MLINDSDQSIWLDAGSPYDESYLFKDVKIYVDSNLKWRGRVDSPPVWQDGFIRITAKGYMDQYKDRVLNETYTIEEEESSSGYTGYITGFDDSGDDDNFDKILDSGKGFGDDEYNGGICFIDVLATIPDTHKFCGIDWEYDGTISTKPQASADDADFGTGTWDNNNTTVIYSDVKNGYIRFPVNIPADSTIDSATLNYHKNVVGAITVTITLIDTDNCPAFPNGAGNENDYPVTGTSVSLAETWGMFWQSKDIKTLLQAFIDRSGYKPGNYIGLRLNSGAGSSELRGWDYDSGGTETPRIDFTYTQPDYPDLSDFDIEDTVAADDSLELDGLETYFSKRGMIVGKPYMISKQTSDIVNTYATDYDLDVEVSVSKTNSGKGIIARLNLGSHPIDIFNQCRKIDGYLLRLKTDMTFLYKLPSEIANSGNLPEDVKSFKSEMIPQLINLVKVQNKDGEVFTRCWDYDGNTPVDFVDGSEMNLPAGYQRREIVLPSPEIYGELSCKDLADAYLEQYAEPTSVEQITLELVGEIDYEAGEKVSFTFEGETYTDYIITYKHFETIKRNTIIKLVKY